VTKVPFSEDHAMIDAFPSDRADQPFGIGILPWRPRRSWSITNTHGADAPGGNLTIDLISIAQQVCWCLVPSAGFRELAGEPLGTGVPSRPSIRRGGDRGAGSASHREAETKLLAPRTDPCNNPVSVIAEKCPPALRRWSPPARHILGHEPPLGQDEVRKLEARERRAAPPVENNKKSKPSEREGELKK
jgi:hypothetical protein